MFWQIPTRGGRAFVVDETQPWFSRCERPPLIFWRRVRDLDEKKQILLSASEHRNLTWSWSLRAAPDTAEAKAKENKGGAYIELGIGVMSKAESHLRELVYSWVEAVGKDSAWVSEETIVPGVWTLKKANVVAEHGMSATTVFEHRDIYLDYKRAFPQEEPGRIMRLYLKIPGRAANRVGEASIGGVSFRLGERPSPEE